MTNLAIRSTFCTMFTLLKPISLFQGLAFLTTGGVIEDSKPATGVPNVMNGPSGGGLAGRGAYSRRVLTGDIVIVPIGVAHGWSQIIDHVTYLSVRPDPDRVLPAGWVYPTLLKNVCPTKSRQMPLQSPATSV